MVVHCPVSSRIPKRSYGHISQDVCPWNRKFSVELAGDSPFRAREFIAGKDAVTLARDILALDQEQFSASFRTSPMKRAKLAGLRRNAAVVLANHASTAEYGLCQACAKVRRHFSDVLLIHRHAHRQPV